MEPTSPYPRENPDRHPARVRIAISALYIAYGCIVGMFLGYGVAFLVFLDLTPFALWVLTSVVLICGFVGYRMSLYAEPDRLKPTPRVSFFAGVILVAVPNSLWGSIPLPASLGLSIVVGLGLEYAAEVVRTYNKAQRDQEASGP